MTYIKFSAFQKPLEAKETDEIVGLTHITGGVKKNARWTVDQLKDYVMKFVPGGGGATSLSGLDDVQIATPVNGQALIYNGAKWVNANVAIAGDYYTKTQSDQRYKPIGWLPQWSDVMNRPTKLSDFTNDLGNYGNFAFANGSNASGTWGINISGSATYWGGRLADFDTVTSDILRLVAVDNATGVVRQAGKLLTQYWLNISDGSTLNNNVSGSSAKWNGLTNDMTSYGTNLYMGLGYDGTTESVKPYLPAAWLTWLGMPSTGATFQSVTNNGNTTTNTIEVGNTISIVGVTPYLQWVTSGVRRAYAQTTNAGLTIRADVGDVFIGNRLVVSNGFSWGSGVYEAGKSQFYNDSDYGTMFIPKKGNVTDLIFHNSLGQTVFNLATETTNLMFTGVLTAPRFVAGSYDSGVNGSFNADNWFRAIGNTGMYFPTYNMGFHVVNGSTFKLYSDQNAVLIKLQTTGGFDRGSVYADSQNNIGFLRQDDNWNWRTDVNGDAFGSGRIVSNTGGGFQNLSYQSGRNRIWSFLDSDNYGLSYYQGAGSIYGTDGIGIHFGNTSAPQFNFKQDGQFDAPMIKAKTKLELPEKNSSNVLTGNVFEIYIQRNI